MATYFVYRATRKKKLPYPENWRLVAKAETYAGAEEEATRLCPRYANVERDRRDIPFTEYYGPDTSDNWSAMVTMHDIHASK